MARILPSKPCPVRPRGHKVAWLMLLLSALIVLFHSYNQSATHHFGGFYSVQAPAETWKKA